MVSIHCGLHTAITFRKKPNSSVSDFFSVSVQKSDFNPQQDMTNGTSTLRDPSAKLGHSGGASSVPPVPQDYSSSVPYQGHHPSHTSVPPLVNAGQAHARAPAGQPLKESVSVDPSRLTCHQCIKQFSTKPMLLSHQVRSHGSYWPHQHSL